MTRTVVFVRPHGAGMSRIAAAFFNLAAPADWHTMSAGLDSQAEVGVNAPRLLAGTPAEHLLDREPPRLMSAIPDADRVIALCCEVPGAIRWDLGNREFNDAMRDEIRARTEAPAVECHRIDAGGS